MQSNSHKSWYEYTGPLVIIAFICYVAYSILKQPYALQSVAICCGVPLLIFLAMVIIGAMLPRKYKAPVLNEFNVSTVKRKSPNFDIQEAYSMIGHGGVIGIASLFLFFPFALVLLLNGIQGGGIGYILLGLITVPASLLQSGMSIKVAWDGVSVLIKKRIWIKSAVRTQAMIVDRRVVCEENTDDYGTVYGSIEYDLALNITNQSTNDTGDQFIEARIGKRLYNKYEHKDTIRIYYVANDPLTLLVKGE